MDRDEGDEMLPLLVLLGTIAGAWYLLIVRPQKDLQTRHGRLVEQLQVGDHVLTVGGIYGRVAAIEGSSVVLELAPGLTSRIATDGIARIVHGGEAALPMSTTGGAGTVDVAPNPPQARDTDMHQHPHADQPQHAAPAPQQPHFAAPTYVAPATPYTAPPAPAPVQHAPVAAPVATTHAPVGSSIPTFEPRPWGDVAPVNAQPAYAQPIYAQPIYAQAPSHVSAPVHAPAPTFTQPVYAAAPMPLHQPFAPQVAPQVQQQYAQPAMAMVAPVVVTHAPTPATVVQPAHHPHHVVEPLVEPAPGERARRHSRAPQGMGSTLRLDDPSLADTMGRAREERAGLAVEYRKLVAPLVDVGNPQEHQLQQPAPVDHAHAQQQLVGHDPNGVPLYATPGAPVAQPIAQYPMPARVEPAHGMPRPVVVAPHGDVDPALMSNAFQRRTPYTPDPALQPAHQQQHAQTQAPGLAHA